MENSSGVRSVSCRRTRTPPLVEKLPEAGRNLGAPIVGWWMVLDLFDGDGGGSAVRCFFNGGLSDIWGAVVV